MSKAYAIATIRQVPDTLGKLIDLPHACIIRKRRDAACLAFVRAVDQMVRDHASLDTSHGIEAQDLARRLVDARPKGVAADADLIVWHQNAMVALRTFTV